MKKIVYSVLTIMVTLLFNPALLAQNYHLVSVSRSRILVDSVFDRNIDTIASRVIAPYKNKVDSLMLPVVGISARYMASYRPESPLSNLLCDILVSASRKYHEKVDFSVYNIGGMRSALPKGVVTYGDILDVAPFENKICFVSLSGECVIQLFRQIASTGGEGVSKEVKLTIARDGKLVSYLLNGKKIIKSKKYRIATIDYVSQGNDHLEAFKLSTDMVMPQGEDNNIRALIVAYFLDCKSKNIIVDSKVEGRITVVK
jgi:2',3'-cyclic-nucleotide 2'-phosphodiesterase (5'-nucleotidase family)